MSRAESRLFVCYVPGLDGRRLDPDAAPFLSGLLRDFPVVSIETLPSTELVATLVTGSWPHEHGFWQVRLRRDCAEGPWSRVLDRLPDPVVTTAQCVLQFVRRDFDLAAIPWRRRRHFELHRFEYAYLASSDLRLRPKADVPSLFDLLGDRARYRFVDRFKAIPRILAEPPREDLDLDLLQFHAFDLLSHWHLDRPEAMRRHLSRVDDLVRGLSERCRESGVRFMLLVDHGQEPIHTRIDLVGRLRESGVPEGEYHYFIEIGLARLWFETERARRELTSMARDIEGLHAFTPGEMRRFHLELGDDRFGDLYLIAEHGHAFFPHDFYQPLANVYLGLAQRELRPRLLDPRHRGNHGQDPRHPAEKGYMILSEGDRTPVTDEMRLVDFAPTVLDLLGLERPDHMHGRPIYPLRQAATA